MVQNLAAMDDTSHLPYDRISNDLVAVEGPLGMLQRPHSSLQPENLTKCVPLMREWESTTARLTDLMHRHSGIEELDLKLEMVIIHCRATRLKGDFKFKERLRQLVEAEVGTISLI
jgi:hypothetical protein